MATIIEVNTLQQTIAIMNTQAIKVYEFGCAPQAVEEGFAPDVTVERGTLQSVLSKYEGQDAAVIYGASVFGTQNQFEFAVLQRA